MELAFIKIHGFKRFARENRLAIESKLTAILGPNESGKTSLLEAIDASNSSDRWVTDGPGQQLTKGQEFDDDHEVVSVLFYLESSEKEEVERLTGIDCPRWFSFSKTKSGKILTQTTPPVRRDLDKRQAAGNLVKVSIDHFTDVNKSEIREAYAPLIDASESSEDSLSANTIERCLELSSQFVVDFEGKLGDPKHVEEFLEDWLNLEKEPSPRRTVSDFLLSKSPDFILFCEEDRILESEYDLRSIFLDDKQNFKRNPEIPKALSNLASVCELNLAELPNLVKARDLAEIKSVVDKANVRLKQMIADTWRQSDLFIELDQNGYILSILVKSDGERFYRLEDRSHGFREFIALVSFLRQAPPRDVPPVLLIDELESKLHYDAQADLINILSSQELIQKCIYTTHSIGCLPNDLGRGVRLIETSKDGSSRINNRFWTSSKSGFSPILYGMGASTLAFVPLRGAIIVEGISDAILLPSLLKEALAVDELGYQVVSGLSEANISSLALLRNEGSRTFYLVDNDEGGETLKKKLIRSGALPDTIVCLSDSGTCVIEDMINPELYALAINLELEKRGSKLRLTPQKLGRRNSPKALDAVCKQADEKTPSKRAIASNVLDISCRREHPLVADDSIDRLCSLGMRLESLFRTN